MNRQLTEVILRNENPCWTAGSKNTDGKNMKLCRLTRPPLKTAGLRFPQREYHLLGRLEKRGHQVDQFDLNPVRPFNEYLSYGLGILGAVFRFRKIKTDIIMADSIESALSAVFIKMVYRIPFIFDFIDDYSMIARYDGFVLRYRLIEIFEKILPKFADVVIVVDMHKKRFCLENGVKPERIVLIPNGTDTKKFSLHIAPDHLPITVRDQGYKIIQYVGRLNQYYRVDVLIHAMALVFQTFSDVRFILIGDGDQTAGLKDLCKSLEIDNRVIFLGFMEPEKMPGLIQGADICLFPLPDSSALAIYEYMACGKAVVIPNDDSKKMGVDRDILPEDGFLKANNSPFGIAAAIKTLLDDDALRYQLGKKARQWIETGYDWDNLALQYEQTLMDLLQEYHSSTQ